MKMKKKTTKTKIKKKLLLSYVHTSNNNVHTAKFSQASLLDVSLLIKFNTFSHMNFTFRL